MSSDLSPFVLLQTTSISFTSPWQACVACCLSWWAVLVQKQRLPPVPADEQGGQKVRALTPRGMSLEQAGGLQRMTLRGHTAGLQKVLLSPSGIDVITGEAVAPLLHSCTAVKHSHLRFLRELGSGEVSRVH